MGGLARRRPDNASPHPSEKASDDRMRRIGDVTAWTVGKTTLCSCRSIVGGSGGPPRVVSTGGDRAGGRACDAGPHPPVLEHFAEVRRSQHGRFSEEEVGYPDPSGVSRTTEELRRASFFMRKAKTPAFRRAAFSTTFPGSRAPAWEPILRRSGAPGVVPVPALPSFPGRRSAQSVLLGKGEAEATPSPLPRGGHFPPFTSVPLSGAGRLRREYPNKKGSGHTWLTQAGDRSPGG
jgi:hypothetical protein